MGSQSNGASMPPTSTIANRISDVVRQLRDLELPLRFGVWDMQIADRRGKAMNTLKGIGDEPKRMKDGYQYVGPFPSHRWRVATTDEHYKTLSYGISQFPRAWPPIRKALDQPYHYVSIGPGTGEKDRIVLRHLQSMASDSTLVYIPIDISGDLLRMGLDKVLQDVDDDRVEILPVELDITDPEAIQALKIVLHELVGDSPVLYSLLGNTLANFSRDRHMLGQIASLLASPADLLFIELATAQEATTTSARAAAKEYEGSKTFRDFAMAALHEYTDIPPNFGVVTPTAEVVDDDHVLRITTHLRANKTLHVNVKDGDQFRLEKDEQIELYISRKYTQSALGQLRTGFHSIASNSRQFGRGSFGITLELLRLEDSEKQRKGLHPVSGRRADDPAEA
jgi:L-histidine Nalpha-methyltransferase